MLDSFGGRRLPAEKAMMKEITRAWAAGENRAARIRAVFASRSLTLHQVSLRSARLYGPESPSRIPHTLYHSLADSVAFGPSLAQVCALSRITSYRLEDWLSILGIDLTKVAALQAILPFRRTRLMDPTFEPVECPAADLVDFGSGPRIRGVFPIAALIGDPDRRDLFRPSFSLLNGRPLFARIGCEDSFAFPELLPGSIVRLDPSGRDIKGSTPREIPPLLLIEHERGLWCGRFHVTGNGVIHAFSREYPYAQIELRCPHEARIVGRVDMEIRWMHRSENPSVPQEFAVWGEPPQLTSGSWNLSSLIHRGRIRAGLTLREGSLLSKRVSRYLGDDRYSIAQSTLSEYEAGGAPPRHIEKVITVCLIYGIKLTDFAAISGTHGDNLGQEPMPESLLCARPFASTPEAHQKHARERSGPIDSLLQEIPRFLSSALPELSQIPRPSLRDFFLIRGNQPFLPAYTSGTVIALADRRKKRPARIAGLRSFAQPAWILLLRGGEYHCACCSVDHEMLVLYPESDGTRSCERLRLGRDVEVIGQMIALARHIES